MRRTRNQFSQRNHIILKRVKPKRHPNRRINLNNRRQQRPNQPTPNPSHGRQQHHQLPNLPNSSPTKPTQRLHSHHEHEPIKQTKNPHLPRQRKRPGIFMGTHTQCNLHLQPNNQTQQWQIQHPSATRIRRKHKLDSNNRVAQTKLQKHPHHAPRFRRRLRQLPHYAANHRPNRPNRGNLQRARTANRRNHKLVHRPQHAFPN